MKTLHYKIWSIWNYFVYKVCKNVFLLSRLATEILHTVQQLSELSVYENTYRWGSDARKGWSTCEYLHVIQTFVIISNEMMSTVNASLTAGKILFS